MPSGKSHHRKPADSSGPIDVNVVGGGGTIPDPVNVNLESIEAGVEPFDVNVVSGGVVPDPLNVNLESIGVGVEPIDVNLASPDPVNVNVTNTVSVAEPVDVNVLSPDPINVNLQGIEAGIEPIDVNLASPDPVNVNISSVTTDLDCATINPGSLIGNISIGDVTPVELKVGVSALANRHTVIIFNDSSFLIFIGFLPGMTEADGILVNSGNNATFRLDPDGTMQLYALAFEGTANIKIMEVK